MDLICARDRSDTSVAYLPERRCALQKQSTAVDLMPKSIGTS